LEIEGSSVLITGASSGIGRTTALAFARRGATVVLAARRKQALDEAAREIARSCPESPAPIVAVCDVTDPEAVRNAVRVCVERTEELDVLVNNAGYSVYGQVEATPLDEMRGMMEVNFFGAVNFILEAIPVMRRQGGGWIVNVASVAGIYGVPYLAAYGATKAALANFSEAIRAELAESGIGVSVVNPGYTQTEIFAKEKTFGTAVRPPGPYAPVETVAEAIVGAVERERNKVVLSTEGKLLSAACHIAPYLVPGAMRKVAAKLGKKV